MGRARYSDMNETAAFGFLANALDNRRGGDGDTGASFPRTDAEDMGKGARFIPGEVTLARRAGKKVNFVTECGPNCWYWEMPDGSRIYHYDPMTYHQIGTANGRKEVKGEYSTHFEDGAGPCPHCGNPNTNGGTIQAVTQPTTLLPRLRAPCGTCFYLGLSLFLKLNFFTIIYSLGICSTNS